MPRHLMVKRRRPQGGILSLLDTNAAGNSETKGSSEIVYCDSDCITSDVHSLDLGQFSGKEEVDMEQTNEYGMDSVQEIEINLHRICENENQTVGKSESYLPSTQRIITLTCARSAHNDSQLFTPTTLAKEKDAQLLVSHAHRNDISVVEFQKDSGCSISSKSEIQTSLQTMVSEPLITTVVNSFSTETLSKINVSSLNEPDQERNNKKYGDIFNSWKPSPISLLNFPESFQESNVYHAPISCAHKLNSGVVKSEQSLPMENHEREFSSNFSFKLNPSETDSQFSSSRANNDAKQDIALSSVDEPSAVLVTYCNENVNSHESDTKVPKQDYFCHDDKENRPPGIYNDIIEKSRSKSQANSRPESDVAATSLSEPKVSKELTDKLTDPCASPLKKTAKRDGQESQTRFALTNSSSAFSNNSQTAKASSDVRKYPRPKKLQYPDSRSFSSSKPFDNRNPLISESLSTSSMQFTSSSLPKPAEQMSIQECNSTSLSSSLQPFVKQNDLLVSSSSQISTVAPCLELKKAMEQQRNYKRETINRYHSDQNQVLPKDVPETSKLHPQPSLQQSTSSCSIDYSNAPAEPPRPDTNQLHMDTTSYYKPQALPHDSKSASYNKHAHSSMLPSNSENADRYQIDTGLPMSSQEFHTRVLSPRGVSFSDIKTTPNISSETCTATTSTKQQRWTSDLTYDEPTKETSTSLKQIPEKLTEADSGICLELTNRSALKELDGNFLNESKRTTKLWSHESIAQNAPPNPPKDSWSDKKLWHNELLPHINKPLTHASTPKAKSSLVPDKPLTPLFPKETNHVPNFLTLSKKDIVTLTPSSYSSPLVSHSFISPPLRAKTDFFNPLSASTPFLPWRPWSGAEKTEVVSTECPDDKENMAESRPTVLARLEDKFSSGKDDNYKFTTEYPQLPAQDVAETYQPLDLSCNSGIHDISHEKRSPCISQSSQLTEKDNPAANPTSLLACRKNLFDQDSLPSSDMKHIQTRLVATDCLQSENDVMFLKESCKKPVVIPETQRHGTDFLQSTKTYMPVRDSYPKPTTLPKSQPPLNKLCENTTMKLKPLSEVNLNLPRHEMVIMHHEPTFYDPSQHHQQYRQPLGQQQQQQHHPQHHQHKEQPHSQQLQHHQKQQPHQAYREFQHTPAQHPLHHHQQHQHQNQVQPAKIYPEVMNQEKLTHWSGNDYYQQKADVQSNRQLSYQNAHERRPSLENKASSIDIGCEQRLEPSPNICDLRSSVSSQEDNHQQKGKTKRKSRDRPPLWGIEVPERQIVFYECVERNRFCDNNFKYQVPDVPASHDGQSELRDALLRLFAHSNLPPVPKALTRDVKGLRFFPLMQTLFQASQLTNIESLRMAKEGLAFENFKIESDEKKLNQILDTMLEKKEDGTYHCLSRKCIDPAEVTCSFTADNIGKMRRHVKNHLPEKKWVCCFCRVQMTDQTDMERHGSTHTRLRPFRCLKCNKPFTQKVTLINHMKSGHNTDLPTDNNRDRYTCRQCGVYYTSEQRSECIEHLRIYHFDTEYQSLRRRKRFPFNLINKTEPEYDYNVDGNSGSGTYTPPVATEII